MKKINLHVGYIAKFFVLIFLSYINYEIFGSPILKLLSVAIACTMLFSVSNIKAFVMTVLNMLFYAFLYTNGNKSFEIGLFTEHLINFFDIYLPALVLARLFKIKKISLYESMAGLTLSNIFIVLLSLSKIKFVDKIDISKEFGGELALFFENFKYILTQTPNLPSVNLEEIDTLLNTVQNTIIMLIPSILIIVCFILSYAELILSKALIGAYTNKKLKNIESFYQIYIGNTISIITLVLLVISFSSSGTQFSFAVFNMAVICSFLYIVNGLAVVYFLLIKKTRKTALSTILLVVVVFVSFLSVSFLPTINGASILFLIGLMDTSMNFRKLKR